MLILALALGLTWQMLTPAQATERRCGWLDNPTPANWYLVDAQGRWIISAQGGFQAQ